MRRARLLPPLLLTALLALACEDGPTGPAPVASLEAEAEALDGTVAQAVPVGIRVLDAGGRPIVGVDVAFAVTEGGSLAADTVPTGSDGVARATWTLGTRAGEQRLTAGAQGHAATVTALARPGPAAALQALGALQRQGTVGAAGGAVSVRALDAWANPVAGERVVFATTAGTLEPTSATTEDNGQATAFLTLPTVAGDVLVTATAADTTVRFAYTARPGAPARLVAVAGAAQTAEVGQPLPLPIQVRLLDEYENGIFGDSVTFKVGAGGGGVWPEVAKTDADGSASASWTLGPPAGTHVLEVGSGALPRLVVEATAVPGPPAQAEPAAGDGQGALHGSELAEPIVVRVSDWLGNPVAGVAVEWRVTEGGGQLTSAEGTTDTAGAAAARWRLGGEGPQRVEARPAGLGAVAFTAVAWGTMTITVDSLATARSGWPYAARLTTAGGGGVTWTLAAGALPQGLALAPDGLLGGTPSEEGLFPVRVRARDGGGAQAEADFELRVCGAALALAPGQTAQVVAPDACGALLPPEGGARYRVGVMARAYRSDGYTADAVQGGLLLRSRAGTPGEAFALRTPRALAPRPPEDGLDPATRALQEATERLHHRLRAEERARFPRVPVPPLGPPLDAAALRADSVPLTRSFFVRGQPVQATLRDSSAHVLYYQDDGVVVENTRATDAEIRALLEYYDAYGDSLVRTVFGGYGPPGTTRNFKDDAGNVLELPADDLDRNGRIIVLQIRPSLMPAGAAAYVSSCDRYPRPEHHAGGPYYCSGSNEAEITYYSRPSSDFYLGSLVHEAKHISSHGYAVFAGRGFQPSWIEEGTAEIAKEKSSRIASGLADGEEAGLSRVQPGGTPTRASYGMAVVHSRSRAFLKASPASGIIGNPNPNPSGSTYYGASWLLHRYLADAYAGGDEATFFRRMNVEGVGTAGIEAVTGRSFGELLAELMTAVAVEGSGAARSVAPVRFRSYDFADVATVAAGTWPYALSEGDFRTEDVPLPTFYSAPNFFDFDAAGGEPLRLDALTLEALEPWANDEVVLTITRIR